MDGQQSQADDFERPEEAGQAPDGISLVEEARGSVEEGERDEEKIEDGSGRMRERNRERRTFNIQP